MELLQGALLSLTPTFSHQVLLTPSSDSLTSLQGLRYPARKFMDLAMVYKTFVICPCLFLGWINLGSQKCAWPSLPSGSLCMEHSPSSCISFAGLFCKYGALCFYLVFVLPLKNTRLVFSNTDLCTAFFCTHMNKLLEDSWFCFCWADGEVEVLNVRNGHHDY